MNPERWSAEEFRGTLIGVALSPNYLQNLHHYPRTINLDANLHSIFNAMRAASASDGEDRFTYIFADTSRRSIVTPRIYSGAPEDNWITTQPDILRYGRAVGLDPVLYLHSYRKRTRPTDFLRFVLRAVFAASVNRPSSIEAAIPPVEMYAFLDQDSPVVGLGVAGGSENLLALRASETVRLTAPYSARGLRQFVEYWTQQWREEYKSGGNPSSININWRNLFNLWINPLAANVAMADEHQFALYRGDMNNDLVRAYPS